MTRFSPTAISRQVVAKKCVRHNPEKGIIGYDQYTAPDTVAVKPTFVASGVASALISTRKHTSMASRTLTFKFL